MRSSASLRRPVSKDELRVGQSALYPALHKLEQQGWIESEWERLSTAISLVVKPA